MRSAARSPDHGCTHHITAPQGNDARRMVTNPAVVVGALDIMYPDRPQSSDSGIQTLASAAAAAQSVREAQVEQSAGAASGRSRKKSPAKARRPVVAAGAQATGAQLQAYQAARAAEERQARDAAAAAASAAAAARQARADGTAAAADKEMPQLGEAGEASGASDDEDDEEENDGEADCNSDVARANLPALAEDEVSSASLRDLHRLLWHVLWPMSQL